MLINYLKIAWRNIYRNKIYSLINIAGLTLGLCSCMAIYSITHFELSFDRFHPDSERIYRVMGDVTEHSGDKLHFARIPFPVSQLARESVPGIEQVTAIIPFQAKIKVEESGKLQKEFSSIPDGTHFITTVITEAQYFTLFPYQWLAGNAATAFDQPFSVVLTESRAQQYFGNLRPEQMIGRQIIYEDSLQVNVSGIVKNRKNNTDLGYTDFISSGAMQSNFLKQLFPGNSWKQGDLSTYTFVKLNGGTKVLPVNEKLNALVKRNAGDQIKLNLWLEPLKNLHFNAEVIENPIRTANLPTIYTLLGVAGFILLLAMINFINLSTVQSLNRSREVGVRKVLGSSRITLIFRFLTETFLLILIAEIAAIFLVNPVLGLFHAFIPPGIVFPVNSLAAILFLSAVLAVTTLLAGFYPAHLLSSHLPAISLKGPVNTKGGEGWLLRKSLIVFQFTISLFFIIGSLVISKQLQYLRNKDLGFSPQAILTVETPRGDSSTKIPVFAEMIRQVPGVQQVALQWLSPMTENARSMRLKFNSADQKEILVTQVAGNENFIPLYGMKILAGRNLLKADSVTEFVINESLSRQMGYQKPSEALGKILYWNNRPFHVTGVVADFHTSSLHDPITPVCIINRPDREGSLAIKLEKNGNFFAGFTKTIIQIEKAWKKIYPSRNFDFRFYDESLAQLYTKDKQTAMLTNTSMAITLFISCIGLFGLALFSAGKRAKEISIRKILGAGTRQLVALLSRDFIFPVMYSVLLACPFAGYYATRWLHSFAYRTSISGWEFFIAWISAVFIAFATVSWLAIRAATANPVENLRTE